MALQRDSQLLCSHSYPVVATANDLTEIGRHSRTVRPAAGHGHRQAVCGEGRIESAIQGGSLQPDQHTDLWRSGHTKFPEPHRGGNWDSCRSTRCVYWLRDHRLDATELPPAAAAFVEGFVLETKNVK